VLWLVFAGLTVFLFLGGLRGFARASVTTIKSLMIWIAALGVLSLALRLVLTGRGGIALGALTRFRAADLEPLVRCASPHGRFRWPAREAVLDQGAT
jgi:hypothetical protein